MKRWVVLLILVCGLGLTACGSSDISFDDEALRADAVMVSDALLNGDYAAITAKFDKTMSNALDAKALEEGWLATVALLGDYEKRGEIVSEAVQGYYAIIITEEFSLQNLNVRVVYDTEGKIAGLQMTFAQKESEYIAAETEWYVEKEITVAADETMPLGGFLTLPKFTENPPVVILVHGSGTSDRNESIYENTPFQDIAYGLAKKGIATLRYDKRHYTYPENAAQLGANLTLRDEVLDDVKAAIALLKETDGVNGEKIFVLGHSLGGMLTPAIAYENEGIAGIISMAGSLRPLYEIVYDQNQEVIAAYQNVELSDDMKETLNRQIAQIENDIAILRGDYSALKNEDVLLGVSVGYWKSLREYEGMNFISEISLPMLILQGDADFQVYADKDYVLWQQTLRDRENVEFALFEGLNHLMMQTQGKRDISEYAVKSTVSEDVIIDIAEFVHKY